MLQNEKLLPCPFCGSDDVEADGVTRTGEYGSLVHYPACNNCSACCEQWNTRALTSPQTGGEEGMTMTDLVNVVVKHWENSPQGKNNAKIGIPPSWQGTMFVISALKQANLIKVRE